MINLLDTLSQDLQNKLADFKVSLIFVEDNELNVRSDYDMDPTYYEAIEAELVIKGFEIE